MDALEQLLEDRLGNLVETDPIVPAGLAARLHQRHRRHQRLVVAGTGVIGVLALGGLSAAVLDTSAGDDTTLKVGRSQDATPVPRITPAWTPTSGRDWLPSKAQFEAFRSTHPIPSLGTEPDGTTAQRLLDEVMHAGLPAGATAVITHTSLPEVRIVLPNGVPIVVERYQKQYPTAFEWGATTPPGATYTVANVPGTTDAAALVSNTGYGWAPGTKGDSDANHDGDSQNDSPSVQLVTQGGLTTFWVSPPETPLDQLRELAFTAAAWSAAHP